MKLKCFVLPTLVISLLGHLTNAGLSKPNQQRILGSDGDLSSVLVTGGLSGSNSGANGPSNEAGSFPGGGEVNFGLTGRPDSVVNPGRSAGADYDVTIAESPELSGVLGGNSARPATDGVLTPPAGTGLGPGLGGGAASPDAGRGGSGGESRIGSTSGWIDDSAGFARLPHGTGHGGDSSGLGAGVTGPGGADLSGFGPLGRGLSGSPNIGAGPFVGIQPIRRPNVADVLGSSLPSVGRAGGYGVMGGPRSPETEGAGPGAPPGDGVPLERVAGGAGNSPGSYSDGSPLGVELSTGSGALSGSLGGVRGGFQNGAAGGQGGLGTGSTGMDGERSSLRLSGGGEGGLLARLRTRIHARAHALAAARARAQARAKARARARAAARARLRARLRGALRVNLQVGGGIGAGLDKAAELAGDGGLGGSMGLGGQGGAATGIAGNGGLGTSSGAGSAFYGGTGGYGSSYGGGRDGSYDFYDE